MEMEVKITDGDLLNDAKAFRVTLTKAVDDTGFDLLNSEKFGPEFQRLEGNGTFKLKLKNPARKAVAIDELTGEAELFVPKKDPAATVVVDSFRKQIDARSNQPRSDPLESKARPGQQNNTKHSKKRKRRKRGKRPEPRDEKASNHILGRVTDDNTVALADIIRQSGNRFHHAAWHLREEADQAFCRVRALHLIPF